MPDEPPADKPPAGDPPPADTPPAIFNEGLDFSDKWRERLDEDMRADPSLETVTNLNSLVKSYLSGQKMIGLDKVALPTENSTPEVWNEFYTKTGRPVEAKGYDFTDVEVSENIQLSEDEMGGMQAAMHSEGLSNSQAKGMYDYYNKAVLQTIESQKLIDQKEHDDGVTALKTQQGHKYQQFVDGANSIIRTFDQDGDIAKLGLDTNPIMLNILGKIAAGISEDKLIGDDGGSSAMTPNDAQTQINKIYANPAYFSKSHPEHEALVHEVQKLNKFAFPNI